MKKCVCFIVLTALVFAVVSADVKIINPVKGVWANKQSLVLELSEGESAYYSLNGSDPRESGFAYDGPVGLDVSGGVEGRIASLDDSRVYEKLKKFVLRNHAEERLEELVRSAYASSKDKEMVKGSKAKAEKEALKGN